MYLAHGLEEGSRSVAQSVRDRLAGTYGCSAGSGIAGISPVGTVYPCQSARWPEVTGGTIRAAPFSALWRCTDNYVLAAFRIRPVEGQDSCARCLNDVICSMSCRIRAIFGVNICSSASTERSSGTRLRHR